MFDPAELIAEAEEKAGFADSELEVRRNLEHLLASMAKDFPVSESGRESIRRNLMMDLVNRIAGLKWITEFPEIAEEPIDSPVFLMGLPRSGTTYFQYLFDRDRRFRLIRTWESTAPLPPSGYDPASVAPRRAGWAEMQRRQGHFEGFEALHLYDEDGSDECHAFMQQSFGAAGYHNLYRVPEYFDFLLDELDLAQTYRIHKRQLQLLQWRSEARPWALKYPNHVIGMKEILAVHPTARMVMTHRDPAQVVGSIAKMTHNLRSMRSAAPLNPHEAGRDMLHFLSRHIDRIMEFDRSSDGGRVIHVDYYALVDEPVGELRRIHSGLGIDTPDDVAESVRAWHAVNPKNARGRNDYSLKEYGLDEAEVLERFAGYIERFAIPREAEGLARIGAAA